MSSDRVVEEAIEALRAGEPVVLPFDTVYGLAADANGEEPTRRLYALKGRDQKQPTALVAASVAALLGLLPELSERARGLLPGPVTLVVPNPARRFPLITGRNPAAIGVRVPELETPAKDVLDRVGAVVATSANAPGAGDPRRLGDVPRQIRDRAGAVVDGGERPGVASTVIDLTGAEPRILREGALPAAEALKRLAAAVRSS